MTATGAMFSEVKAVVVKTLGLDERADGLTADTPLLEGLPEFDSMAVLQVMLALEEHFGLTIDADEVSGELFETVGTLSAFVARKLTPARA
jgi:acyl carrier protein